MTAENQTLEKILKFRNLQNEILQNEELPKLYKDLFVEGINEQIRGIELSLREDDYIEGGYYLGYFLIASQRIEHSIKLSLFTAEKVQAMRQERSEHKLDLEVPLGRLISNLEKYINSDDVFNPLNEFRLFRNKVIHRLYSDYSKNLYDIENTIINEYPKNRIHYLQAVMIKVSAYLANELTTKDDMANQFVIAINSRVDELLPNLHPRIRIL